MEWMKVLVEVFGFC